MRKVAGYRVMLGLTQYDVSKLLGLSRQGYSEKERGNIPFKDSEKKELKNLFKQINESLTIDDIFFE